jgi:hypothetical protein
LAQLSAAILSLLYVSLAARALAQPVAMPTPAATVGSISAIQGKVTILRAGRPLTAAYGMRVQVGDRISTERASQVTITLTDGTQLELTESSVLVMVTNRVDARGQRAQTRIDLFRGLLHSLVRFAPGNAPNYEVHTPNAVAAARGTNYDTDYSKGVARKTAPGCLEFTDVKVFEGTVAVANPGNPKAPAVAVTRHHQSTVACLLAPTLAIASGSTVGMTSSSGTTTTTSSAGMSALTSAAIAGGATVAGAAGVVGGLAVTGAIGGGGASPSPSPAVISPSM